MGEGPDEERVRGLPERTQGALHPPVAAPRAHRAAARRRAAAALPRSQSGPKGGAVVVPARVPACWGAPACHHHPGRHHTGQSLQPPLSRDRLKDVRM